MSEYRNMINSADDAERVLRERKPINTKIEKIKVNHAEFASLTIKILAGIKIDPFVRRVMTLRVMGPLITGHEKSHIAIALELGASVTDVVDAEKYGVTVIESFMKKVSNNDFINKFNRDDAVDRAVKQEMDKSAGEMRNPKGGNNVTEANTEAN
jgi:hypothetical protein